MDDHPYVDIYISRRGVDSLFNNTELNIVVAVVKTHDPGMKVILLFITSAYIYTEFQQFGKQLHPS